MKGLRSCREIRRNNARSNGYRCNGKAIAEFLKVDEVIIVPGNCDEIPMG